MNQAIPKTPHKIQLDILTKLTTSDRLKYSELKPHNLESDLFNYHLQFLVQKKYVKKIDSSYELDKKGKLFVSNMSALGEVKELFKVSTIVYLTRKIGSKREILLQKRLRHPFKGDVTSIAGKIRRGEMPEATAKRKLYEEAGLVADFRFIGVLRKISRDENGEVLEDTLYHVCHAEKYEGELVPVNIFGENFWDTFDAAIEFEKNNNKAIYSIEVIERIRDRNFNFFYFVDDFKAKKY